MRTAIVVGAGIAGLATAGALARTGWAVTLLEREDRLRPGKAALILQPNGVRALQALGLAGGLDAVATPVGQRGIRRADGTWLVHPDHSRRPVDDQPVIVHRENLHDALIAGLSDHVDIRTSVQVKSVPPTAARPAVSDGKASYEADLVIGADGAESVIRRRLAGEATFVPAGCAAWRALIPWYRAPQLPQDAPASCDIVGVGHTFGYLPIGTPGSPTGTSREGVYWSATAPGAPRPEPAETQLGLLRRWFAGWPEPTATLLAATAPEDLVQQAVGELQPAPAALGYMVGGGGYALVGDAGHAMTHHLAQGAALALEDAVTLRTVLREARAGRGLAGALGDYSKRRQSRVAKVARHSRQVGLLLQERIGLVARARDLAMRRSGPKALDRADAEATYWYPPSS